MSSERKFHTPEPEDQEESDEESMVNCSFCGESHTHTVSCDCCNKEGCWDGCLTCFSWCGDEPHNDLHYLCNDCEFKYREEDRFCGSCQLLNPDKDEGYLGPSCIDSHCFGCFSRLNDKESKEEYCERCTQSVSLLLEQPIFQEGVAFIVQYLDLADYKSIEETHREKRAKGEFFCRTCGTWDSGAFCTGCALLCLNCTDFEEECECGYEQ